MTEKSPADTIEAARWEILLMIDIMRIIGNAQVGGSQEIDEIAQRRRS